MSDGIARDAEEARSLVELLDAIKITQSANGSLAGRGGQFGVGIQAIGEGGKGKCGAGAQSEDPADQPLLPHRNSDDTRRERALLDELKNGQIVGKRAGRGDDLDKIRAKTLDTPGRFLQVFGA